MLDGINKIDWANLHHAYGSAADVPQSLRDLASPQKKIREEAYERLYSNIWHQGTVYEATSYAVPFLIELVQNPDTPQRSDIFAFLRLIARGNSYLAVHGRLDVYYQKRQTPEFRAELKEELEHVAAARAAVLAGVPVYIELLQSSDQNVQAGAFETLIDCVESYTVIEPALLKYLAAQSDPKLKRITLQGLNTFWLRLINLPNAPETLGAAHYQAIRELFLSDLASELDASFKAELVTALTTLNKFTTAFALNESGASDEHQTLLSRLAMDTDQPPQVRIVAFAELLKTHRDVYIQDALTYFDRVMNALPEILALHDLNQGRAYMLIATALEPVPRVKLDWLLKHIMTVEPKIQKSMLGDMSRLCDTWRWAPALVAPTLGKLLNSHHDEIQLQAASILGNFGKTAGLVTNELIEAANDPDKLIRMYSARALKTIRGEDKWYTDPWWLRPVSEEMLRTPTRELMQPLQAQKTLLQSNPQIYATIRALGEKSHDALGALPLLEQMLKTGSAPVRILSAYAIWRIAPTQVENVLTTLIETLTGGSMAVMAVHHLALMGTAASPALPRLREIANSETRFGSSTGIIEEDEVFQDTARGEVIKIERDAKQ